MTVSPQPVTRLIDLDDRPGLGAVDRLLGDRFVELRVEPLALRREQLDADALERRDQLVVDQLDALSSGSSLAAADRSAATRRSRLSIAGSSSLRELGDAALLGGGRLARRALAVVLEVGLRPLRQRQVLVAPSAP